MEKFWEKCMGKIVKINAFNIYQFDLGGLYYKCLTIF